MFNLNVFFHDKSWGILTCGFIMTDTVVIWYVSSWEEWDGCLNRQTEWGKYFTVPEYIVNDGLGWTFRHSLGCSRCAFILAKTYTPRIVSADGPTGDDIWAKTFGTPLVLLQVSLLGSSNRPEHRYTPEFLSAGYSQWGVHLGQNIRYTPDSMGRPY